MFMMEQSLEIQLHIVLVSKSWLCTKSLGGYKQFKHNNSVVVCDENVFLAHRAISIIAFHGVESIYIYIV